MILIINCGSTKSPHILDHCLRHAEAKMIDLTHFTSKDLQGITALVISGAPILVTEVETDPYLNQFDFLKTFKLPVLGICFGHQILGMIHGANASRCDEDRTWQKISTLSDHFLFKNLSPDFDMIEDHCECIDLPKEFNLLASSTICQNEVMIHQSKPYVGVQFHPEVSEDNGVQFFDNFFNNFLA